MTAQPEGTMKLRKQKENKDCLFYVYVCLVFTSKGTAEAG